MTAARCEPLAIPAAFRVSVLHATPRPVTGGMDSCQFCRKFALNHFIILFLIWYGIYFLSLLFLLSPPRPFPTDDVLCPVRRVVSLPAAPVAAEHAGSDARSGHFRALGDIPVHVPSGLSVRKVLGSRVNVLFLSSGCGCGRLLWDKRCASGAAACAMPIRFGAVYDYVSNFGD